MRFGTKTPLALTKNLAETNFTASTSSVVDAHTQSIVSSSVGNRSTVIARIDQLVVRYLLAHIQASCLFVVVANVSFVIMHD